MSEIKAFLRFCPSCGQRFHVRLVGEELVGTDVGKATVEQPAAPAAPAAPGRQAGRTVAEAFGSAQLMVEEDEYQFSYKCKHCGHEWSERHVKEVKGNEPRGYTGD